MQKFKEKRRIDDFGRIAIPKEIRAELGVKTGDELDIRLVAGHIIITKPQNK